MKVKQLRQLTWRCKAQQQDDASLCNLTWEASCCVSFGACAGTLLTSGSACTACRCMVLAVAKFAASAGRPALRTASSRRRAVSFAWTCGLARAGACRGANGGWVSDQGTTHMLQMRCCYLAARRVG